MEERDLDATNLKAMFKATEIFADLNETEILDIIRTARFRELKAGEVIFDMGQVGDAMFLVQEGQVRIMQVFPDGTREILANLGRGQVFGEMAILDGSPRAARAVAVTACRLCQIDRSEFNVLRANYQPAAYKVIRAIARMLSTRLRDTNRKVVNFFEDAERSLEYLQARRQAVR